MNEKMMQQMVATAERLSAATESLDRVLEKLNVQQEVLNAKIDRIVAMVDETLAASEELVPPDAEALQKIAELERMNADLKAQAARTTRKTLSPVVSALLGKNEFENERIDAGAIDKTLAALSVEQRIAVKAEMARAGMIE
jgi:ABC-type transporter Mla subunit MlaD